MSSHPPPRKNHSTRRRPVTLLLAAMAVFTAVPSWANDPARLLRDLMQKLEQNERENVQQRERQEALQRQREAEELRRQQQQAAEQQRQAQASAQAQAKQLAALAPPPEWSGRLVMHRQVLEMDNAPPRDFFDLRYDGASLSVSANGKWLAYRSRRQGQVIVQPLNGEAPKVLASLPSDAYTTLGFVGSQALLIESRGQQNSKTLVDLEGRTLRSWPMESLLTAYQDHVFAYQGGSANYCARLAVYDSGGQPVVDLDLSAQDPQNCYLSIDEQGRIVTRWTRGRKVTVLINGKTAAQFDGDDRIEAKDSRGWYVITDDLRYAVSGMNPYSKEQPGPFRVWDIAANRMLCELPSHTGHVLKVASGQLWVNKPVAVVDLPNCKLKPIDVPGDLKQADRDVALIFDESSKRLTVVDSETHAVRAAVQFPDMPNSEPGERSHVQRAAPGSSMVVAGAFFFAFNAENRVLHMWDWQTGQVVRHRQAGLLLSKHFIAQKISGNAADGFVVRLHRIPQPASNTAAANPAKTFVESLRKDKYETTTEYRARVGKLSLPYEMTVRVRDYDADSASFSATLHGVAIGIPMAAAQARQLDGQSTLKLRGQLRAVDEDFLELRQAEIVLRDGGTLPVPQSELPPRRRSDNANAHGAPAQAQRGTTAPSPAPVAASGSGVPAHCTDAALTRLIQPEVNAAQGAQGICGAATAMHKVALKGLELANNCPMSAPGIPELRQQMATLRDQTRQTMAGSCSR